MDDGRAEQDFLTSFHQARKRERKLKLALFGVITVVVTLVAGLVYLSATNELRFVGEETALTTGAATRVGKKPFAKQYVKLNVTYVFTVDGKQYTGTQVVGKSTGLVRQGDNLQIKYAVTNPAKSKIVGVDVSNTTEWGFVYPTYRFGISCVYWRVQPVPQFPKTIFFGTASFGVI